MRTILLASMLSMLAGAGGSWAILSVRVTTTPGACVMSSEERAFLDGHRVPMSGYRNF